MDKLVFRTTTAKQARACFGDRVNERKRKLYSCPDYAFSRELAERITLEADAGNLAKAAKVETVRSWFQTKKRKMDGKTVYTVNFPSSPEHLSILADVLDCDVDYLLGRSSMPHLAEVPAAEYLGLSEAATRALHDLSQEQKRALSELLLGKETAEDMNAPESISVKTGPAFADLLNIVYNYIFVSSSEMSFLVFDFEDVAGRTDEDWRSGGFDILHGDIDSEPDIKTGYYAKIQPNPNYYPYSEPFDYDAAAAAFNNLEAHELKRDLMPAKAAQILQQLLEPFRPAGTVPEWVRARKDEIQKVHSENHKKYFKY